jgi:hypothetical protein
VRPVEGYSGEELLRQEIDLDQAEYGDADWEGTIRRELTKVGARILAAAMTSPAEIDQLIADYVLEEDEDPQEAAKDCARFAIDEKVDRITVLIWGAFDTTLPEGGKND